MQCTTSLSSPANEVSTVKHYYLCCCHHRYYYYYYYYYYLISIRKGEDYAKTLTCIRGKVSFSTLRSAPLCLRGSRSIRRRATIVKDIDLDVELVRSRVQMTFYCHNFFLYLFIFFLVVLLYFIHINTDIYIVCKF